jgi:predicted HicB family RNase H-like nuclease
MSKTEKPSSDEKQQFNVYLSQGLIREIKHLAVDTSQSLSSLVETALREYLENFKQTKGE